VRLRERLRKKKHEEKSLYAELVIITKRIRLDPPLDELPTPAAAWRQELVPFSLSHSCAADCPGRHN
jgi:hypothetical protein